MERQQWFSDEEYRARIRALQAIMRDREVDFLVAFHPSSVTYLTGFFTFGWLLLNFAVVPADGDPIVVCRDNEEYWFNRHAAFAGHEFWRDGEDVDPAGLVARAVKNEGASGARIGVESAYPYDTRLDSRLRELLPEATIVDLGDRVVGQLRDVKSPAELEYMRAASRAVEAGMAAGIRAAGVGVNEREVAAETAAALVRAGSDVAGPGPIASGERAANIHGKYEDRVLADGDTLNLEVDGCVRFYFSRFFRTVKIGHATRDEEQLAPRLLRLQERAWAEVADGSPVAVPDRIIREGVLAEGVARYTNNSFYSIGFDLAPTPRTLAVVADSDWTFRAGMTFHSYVKVGAFFFSETIAVTDSGIERLTNYPRELIVA